MNERLLIEHWLTRHDEKGSIRFQVDGESYSIGKAARSDIRLATRSPLVAATHAILNRLEHNGAFYYQVKAANYPHLSDYELRVNGKKLESYRLQDGDTINFVSHVFLIYHRLERTESIDSEPDCIFSFFIVKLTLK